MFVSFPQGNVTEPSFSSSFSKRRRANAAQEVSRPSSGRRLSVGCLSIGLRAGRRRLPQGLGLPTPTGLTRLGRPVGRQRPAAPVLKGHGRTRPGGYSTTKTCFAVRGGSQERAVYIFCIILCGVDKQSSEVRAAWSVGCEKLVYYILRETREYFVACWSNLTVRNVLSLTRRRRSGEPGRCAARRAVG